LRLYGDNVKKFIKLLGYLAVGLVLLVLAAVMYEKYKHYLWKPPTSLHGISVGMSRSDVVFALGDDKNCEEAFCIYQEPSLVIRMTNDKVTNIFSKVGYIGGAWDSIYPPFTTTEEMKDILGDEDILSISQDFTQRRYTYLKHGVTFDFRTNDLTNVMIGGVRWRQSLGDTGEYFVRGKQVCPSPDCPFGEDGKVKPQYKDKSYKDFL
jgi:hypothetical protein